MDLSFYGDLKAAYGFKILDLHTLAKSSIEENFTQLINNEIYLNSDVGGLNHLFISVKTANISVRTFDELTPKNIVLDLADVVLSVFVLSDQQYQSGSSPQDGLATEIRVDTTEVLFEVQLITRKVLRTIYEEDLRDTPKLSSQVNSTPLEEKETISLGAVSHSEVLVELTNKDSDASVWLEKAFPKYKDAIERVIVADIVLIHDVRGGICKNIILDPDKDVESFDLEYFPSKGGPYSLFVIGSRYATLLAPDCPTIFSKAILDPSLIDEAKRSVIHDNGDGTGHIAVPNLRVSAKSLVRDDYISASQTSIGSGYPVFHLWMSKSILEKSFNHRLGNNIGALIGAHYDDSWGIVKWWLSGGWVLKQISGGVRIAVTSATVEVDFHGRTKFDAMGYVDLSCTQIEIGSMDAFHEKFDFTLYSGLFVSWRDGRVIFNAGFKNVNFDDWRSFLRFFLDKYVSSWKYVVARLIVDFIFSKILKSFVEDQVTDAMGSISIDLLNLSDLPIVGNWFGSTISEDPTNWPRLSGSASATQSGIEFVAGAQDG